MPSSWRAVPGRPSNPIGTTIGFLQVALSKVPRAEPPVNPEHFRPRHFRSTLTTSGACGRSFLNSRFFRQNVPEPYGGAVGKPSRRWLLPASAWTQHSTLRERGVGWLEWTKRNFSNAETVANRSRRGHGLRVLAMEHLARNTSRPHALAGKSINPARSQPSWAPRDRGICLGAILARLALAGRLNARAAEQTSSPHGRGGGDRH